MKKFVLVLTGMVILCSVLNSSLSETANQPVYTAHQVNQIIRDHFIMDPGNQTRKYTKDREHGKMGIEERRNNHATQCVHTGVQSQDRHRGA